MAILRVGPFSAYASIAEAMADAGPVDTIILEDDYSTEIAEVLFTGMTITGGAGSVGITLRLASGVTSVTLAGLAAISLDDSADGNAIVGNDGNNLITVTGGADAVDGGAGKDRLIVDYTLATGGVTGDSTSNFTEAGGGGRMVTVTAGTIEHFTILTGSGADTITTGNGNDIIRTGNGASTVSAGQGANTIFGGRDADTITALDGGNLVEAGNGANTVTTGAGEDTIHSGTGADTITSGAGADLISLRGGADSANGGADFDILVVDYSDESSDVTGGVTGGNIATGHTGRILSVSGDVIDFVQIEKFHITTGRGNDNILTGGAADYLSGGAGHDTLNGGMGDNRMLGGAGHDVYVVNSAGDRVFETTTTTSAIDSGGVDTVRSAVNFSLAAYDGVRFVERLTLTGTDDISGTGNALANLIVGNSGDNMLDGRLGNDRLDGGLGNDTLLGGAGDDTYVVNATGDRVFETTTTASTIDSGGTDTVQSAVSFNLDTTDGVRFVERLTLTGTANVNGTGNALANTLTGNDGNNVLKGGLGDDSLLGGAGNDTFVFNTALGATNIDRISDFDVAGETIRLDGMVFAGLAAGTLSASAFSANLTGAATDALDRIIYETDTGRVYFDVDGNGAGSRVHFATLTTDLAMTNADFVVF